MLEYGTKNTTKKNISYDRIPFPINTKYQSNNPISKWLINRFISSFLFLFSNCLLPGKRLLDIGCGEGVMLHQIERTWPSFNLTGLDVEKELLIVARQIVPDATYISGSIYELPFHDASYDMVVCTEVLEHLTDPELALKEILRVGNNFFLFSVPNEPWWRLANMARGCYLSDLGNTPGHLNHWGRASFTAFISKYFKIVSIRCPFPWTMVLCQKQDYSD